MDRERQKKAPIYEALEAFKKKRVVPFDVPGHKRGRGNPELVQLLGEKCVSLDVNSMKPLDNLCHPVSVIREAEELAAEAFGAASAYLMVGGTTSAVQSMILSVVKAGDKIILPRNVHKSVINALVLCGGIPIYVNPEMNQKLGISLGMQVEKVKQAIEDNPDAVAVFVNNPTYYGICSDIKTIVQLAHARGMKVLADEAHGTHLYFGKNLPISAMAAGADMAAVSMHKSGGSLTQSSLLLLNKGVNTDYVRQIINLTQTTSASYLLLSSLDISRRNLALRGEESFAKVVEMAEYARREINSIGGYYAYGKELDASNVSDVEEISGHGVTAKVNGRQVAAGNAKLMKSLNLVYTENTGVGTVVHVAVDGNYAGYILISDVIKDGAKEAIASLKNSGVKKCVMLTGDSKTVAEHVAGELKLDEVHSELLPADKVSCVEKLLQEKGAKEKLAFVGDGINDAPVLSRADIGIAMGALGSDAAIEAADVVLMDDNPAKIALAMRISRKCLRIVYENIVFALAVKAICLILGALGIANMWVAIFADVGVMVLAVLNAIRCLRIKNN